MKNIVRRFASVSLCLFFALALAAHADEPRPGDDFLQLVDAKKYGESWDIASDFLKQSVSRAEWINQLVKVRDTIGQLALRTFKSAVPQTNPPGAPPGEYMLMTYDSVFASQGAPRTETLALVKAPDGRWRVVGYFIR
jgi:hypothetical protein